MSAVFSAAGPRGARSPAAPRLPTAAQGRARGPATADVRKLRATEICAARVAAGATRGDADLPSIGAAGMVT